MDRIRPCSTAYGRPEESPVSWFSEFLIALHRGDYAQAAEAQRHLNRLGWSVRQMTAQDVRGGTR